VSPSGVQDPARLIDDRLRLIEAERAAARAPAALPAELEATSRESESLAVLSGIAGPVWRNASRVALACLAEGNGGRRLVSARARAAIERQLVRRRTVALG
jgi:hypothetical protein